MLILLIALTSITTFDVWSHKGCHVWPPIIVADKLKGAVLSRVTSCEIIMAGLKYFPAQGAFIGNVQFTLEINKAVLFFPSGDAFCQSTRGRLS